VAYVTIPDSNGLEPRHGNEKRGFVMMKESVKMYSLSTCSHCKATKKLLDECTIAYEFTDVDLLKGKERAAILEDVKKFNPNCSFPTIIIGDKVIVGYKEKEIKEALGIA
jgi:glutaredoxin-like protein NrdH